MDGLKNKAAQGLSYGLIGRVVLAGLQILTSLATARYLSPSDFGVVAFAMVYINFLAQFSDFGISTAVVQRGDQSYSYLNVAFTLKLCIGLVLTGTSTIVGLAVVIFGSPASGLVVCLLSISFLLGSFAFVPQVQLTLDFDYKRLLWISIVSSSLSTAVCVALLAAGWGYWAVAIAYLVAVMGSVGFFNIVKPYSYRLAWNQAVVRTLLGFGTPLFLTGLISFFVTYSGNLVIGIVSGPGPLGFYAFAFSFSFMLVNQVGGMMAVLFPLYSRMRADGATLKAFFLKSLEYTVAFAVLVNVGMICLAEPLLYLVLGGGGPKWLPALPTFVILCTSGVLAAMLFTVAPVVVAIGKPKAQLRAVTLSALLQLILIGPALHFAGIEGVAVVSLLGYVIQVAAYLPALRSGIGVEPRELVRAAAPSMIAGLAMVAMSRGFFQKFPTFGTVDASFLVMTFQAAALLSLFVLVQGGLTRWRLLAPLREMVGRV